MKNNFQFELVHIQELPSVFNRELPIDKESLKSCQPSYLVVFQYQADYPSVGLHVSIRYVFPDGKVLMQEGATIIAKIEGWSEMSHDEANLRADSRVQALVSYGLSFVSGMIYRRASGTVMNNIFVPYMDIKQVIDNVLIEEVKKADKG